MTVLLQEITVPPRDDWVKDLVEAVVEVTRVVLAALLKTLDVHRDTTPETTENRDCFGMGDIDERFAIDSQDYVASIYLGYSIRL